MPPFCRSHEGATAQWLPLPAGQNRKLCPPLARSRPRKVSHSVSAPASGSRLSSEPLLIVRLPCGTSPQHPTSLDRVFPSFCNSQAKSLSCVLEARLRWSMKGPSAVTGHNGSKKCRNWTSDSAQFCKRGPAEAAGRMSYGQTRWRFSALVVW